jgi:hypothetical protein
LRNISLAILLLFLLAACAPLGTQTYDFATFTFQYPAGWKTMAEISPAYKSGQDYMWLHINEDLTVTSAKEEGGKGLNFTVASREHSSASILTFTHWTYSTLEDYIRDLNQAPVTVDGIDGTLYHYDRQLNDQWFQFQDVWVEKGMLSYLLSFQAADLGDYEKEIKLILESFTFK